MPDSTATTLPKQYRPDEHEPRIWDRWVQAKAFEADPRRVLDGEAKPYCILMPPPNVTAALHLGHALNGTIQDILIRAHRMKGFEALWMPGADHAGIATQTVVDKRLQSEGKPALADYKRKELAGENGREQFIDLVLAWKDEYSAIIKRQFEAMGCGADWRRYRFTMDEICARAVREAFFRLFRDGLIYRGKRLVNWDPVTQTALADDEVEDQVIDGFFYYMKYPVVDDAGAETGEHVTVATTRPETYMGDTAIAVNKKDTERAAFIGKKVMLPLVGRIIPVIEDDYVVIPDPESSDPKAKFASGFLKVTPAHDTNDWALGQRHGLEIINILAPDATISDQHGWTDTGDADRFLHMDRYEARQAVVAYFTDAGLMADKRPYSHSVGHSYRSHVPIEPYLSDQWYCKVTDDKLRGSAQRALIPEQRTEPSLNSWPESKPKEATGDGDLTFYPDRYAKTYETWHDNLRDWCISRQLWWGHRIPVWSKAVTIPDKPEGAFGAEIDEGPFDPADFPDAKNREQSNNLYIVRGGRRYRVEMNDLGYLFHWLLDWGHPVPRNATDTYSDFDSAMNNEIACVIFERISDGARFTPGGRGSGNGPFGFLGYKPAGEYRVFICLNSDTARTQQDLEEYGFVQDPDVLDTWFSSALWPLSTMGWPSPKCFSNTGKDPILDAPVDTRELLPAFNPTSVLTTAREIITLWVSRMVMFNRYFLPETGGTGFQPVSPKGKDGQGPIPFHDVFIHAMIQDGEGRKMSKSLGNGVDPFDIIASHGADAMRFTLAKMTTQTQDVRMPVVHDPETGTNTSPKFDEGRNFCNKLWNAARFTLAMLDKNPPDTGETFTPADLSLADRWMLARLESAVRDINDAISNYQFSAYAQAMYDLLWRDFCDWYLEAIKPQVTDDAGTRATLRVSLETILRLLHPITPFVSEAVHERLRDVPMANIEGVGFTQTKSDETLCQSGWPEVDAGVRDEASETEFEWVRSLVRTINETRAAHKVEPKRKVTLHAPVGLGSRLEAVADLVRTLAGLEKITSESCDDGAVFTLESSELRLSNLADAVDAGAERERLTKQREDLTKRIGGMQGRLSNPGYVDKAPAHLVQQTRDELSGLQDELATVENALEGLE